MSQIIRKRSLLAVILIVVLATAGMLIYREAFAKALPTFRTVAAERGNVQQTVSLPAVGFGTCCRVLPG